MLTFIVLQKEDVIFWRTRIWQETSMPYLNKFGVFFSLKIVCLICQDQTAVLSYFTYLGNFMGCICRSPMCSTATAAGVCFGPDRPPRAPRKRRSPRSARGERFILWPFLSWARVFWKFSLSLSIACWRAQVSSTELMSRIRGEKVYPFLLSKLRTISSCTSPLAPLPPGAHSAPDNLETTARVLQWHGTSQMIQPRLWSTP